MKKKYIFIIIMLIILILLSIYIYYFIFIKTNNKNINSNLENNNLVNDVQSTNEHNVAQNENLTDIIEYNNIDITKELKELSYPKYSEEFNNYIKKLYNDKGSLFYQEYEFKPLKILDINFSGDLNKKKENDSYTLIMKLPSIWLKEGNYDFSYDNGKAFEGNNYLFDITEDFNFKIDNLYFLNNGINKFQNFKYYTGTNDANMDYIVIFDPEYIDTGVRVFIKLNNSIVSQFYMFIPYSEVNIITEILNSIELLVK